MRIQIQTEEIFAIEIYTGFAIALEKNKHYIDHIITNHLTYGFYIFTILYVRFIQYISDFVFLQANVNNIFHHLAIIDASVNVIFLFILQET